MLKWILRKVEIIFNIGVYTHRFIDGLNDLRYEFYNASAHLIPFIWRISERNF